MTTPTARVLNLSRRLRRSALLTLVCALGVASAQDQIAFSPDITVRLDGQTLADEHVAADDLAGVVTPLLNKDALPPNVDLQAYHHAPDPSIGELFVLDATVALPGGVLATPQKVIAYREGVFTAAMDLADCGLPSNVRIDGLTRGQTTWFSFDTTVTLGGITFDDEDIAALSTGCNWTRVFDGSAAGLAAGLDVDGIHFQSSSGVILLSLDASGKVAGVAFDDEDVLTYDPAAPAWAMLYDASALHADAWRSADLDALGFLSDGDDPDGPGDPDPVVPDPPSLRVRPAALSFELRQNDPPDSQPFTIQALDGELSYTVRPGSSWMSSDPAAGSSSGEVDTLRAIVDPAGLPVGVYTRPLFINGDSVQRTIYITLTVTPGPLPPGPSVPEHAAVNAAGMIPFGEPGHAMAPQSVVAIFGSRLANAEQLAQTIPLPLSLGGVSVTFDGLPAGIFYASPDQLVVQLPGALLPTPGPALSGSATMVVSNTLGSSAPRAVQLNTFSPAIFSLNQTGAGQGVVVFSNTADLVAPIGVSAASRPATEGDVITIYANGLGPVEPPVPDRRNSCDPSGVCAADLSNLVLRNTVTRPIVTIGGVRIPDQDILFSGLSPLFVGLNEIIIRIPSAIPAGPAVPLIIEMQGLPSRDDLTIAVQ